MQLSVYICEKGSDTSSRNDSITFILSEFATMRPDSEVQNNNPQINYDSRLTREDNEYANNFKRRDYSLKR